MFTLRINSSSSECPCATGSIVPTGGSDATTLRAGPESPRELPSSAPDPPPPQVAGRERARPGSSRGLDRVGTDPSDAADSSAKFSRTPSVPKKCGDVLPKAEPLKHPGPRNRGLGASWDRPEGRRGEGPVATGRATLLPEATGGARIARAGAATAGRTRPCASRHLRHRAGVFAAPTVGLSTSQRLSEGARGRGRPVRPAGWALLRQLPTARGSSVK